MLERDRLIALGYCPDHVRPLFFSAALVGPAWLCGGCLENSSDEDGEDDG